MVRRRGAGNSSCAIRQVLHSAASKRLVHQQHRRRCRRSSVHHVPGLVLHGVRHSTRRAAGCSREFDPVVVRREWNASKNTAPSGYGPLLALPPANLTVQCGDGGTFPCLAASENRNLTVAAYTSTSAVDQVDGSACVATAAGGVCAGCPRAACFNWSEPGSLRLFLRSADCSFSPHSGCDMQTGRLGCPLSSAPRPTIALQISCLGS